MNKKMILLSESDVPLYSPHVTYLQLLMETRSRLNACKNEGVSRLPLVCPALLLVCGHSCRAAEPDPTEAASWQQHLVLVSVVLQQSAPAPLKQHTGPSAGCRQGRASQLGASVASVPSTPVLVH